MPRYQFRCSSEKCNRLSEEYHTISSYPREIVCHFCFHPAKVIVTGGNGFGFKDGFFRPGPDIGAGRSFASAAERREWMRQENMSEVCPEDSSKYLEYRQRMLEAKRDGAAEPEYPDKPKGLSVTYSGREPQMPDLPGIKFVED